LIALGRWIDEHARLVHIWLVLAPPLIGAPPLTGLINPLWGSLFGFPLYAAARGHPVHGGHPVSELLALFLWPLVVLAAMAVAAAWLLRPKGWWRNALVLLWAISALIVIPIDRAGEMVPGWPIYVLD
jgi:hypothetical protein